MSETCVCATFDKLQVQCNQCGEAKLFVPARGAAALADAVEALRENIEWWKREAQDGLEELESARETLRNCRKFIELYRLSADGHARVIAENLIKNIDALLNPDLTAEGGQRLTQAEAERDDALAEARRWKGHHETQVRWKRRGHERMKAHYEAKVNDLEARLNAAIEASSIAEAGRLDAEAERDALRAKAALADEQYGEGKVRSHAYWLARYDALERESGETQ